MYIFDATSAVQSIALGCRTILSFLRRSVTCLDLCIRSGSPEGGVKDASERGHMVESHLENVCKNPYER